MLLLLLLLPQAPASGPASAPAHQVPARHWPRHAAIHMHQVPGPATGKFDITCLQSSVYWFIHGSLCCCDGYACASWIALLFPCIAISMAHAVLVAAQDCAPAEDRCEVLSSLLQSASPRSIGCSTAVMDQLHSGAAILVSAWQGRGVASMHSMPTTSLPVVARTIPVGCMCCATVFLWIALAWACCTPIQMVSAPRPTPATAFPWQLCCDT